MKTKLAIWFSLLFCLGFTAIIFLPRLSRPPLGGNYEYDIRQYRKTDPALILYSEIAPIPTHLGHPTGLALGAGDTLWCVGDSNLVHVTADGRLLRNIPLPGAPQCVAAATNGLLYMGMRRQVMVCDPASDTLSAWTELGENAVITSLALSTNCLYVADAGSRRVARFDLSGALLGLMGDKDKSKDVPGFVIPSPNFDVAIAPGGSLWIVNPGNLRVENYDPADGRRLSAWGKPGMAIDAFCGCCNPSHLAIRSDGSFVTSEKGLPRVKIYGPDGAFRGVVAGPEQFNEDTLGLDLAVDGSDRIHVLDPARNLIRIFVAKEETPLESKP